MNRAPRRLLLIFIIHHSSFIILLISRLLFAQDQVIRLPAVVPPEESPPGQLVSHPIRRREILQAPGETDVAPATPPPGEPRIPPGVRNGVFQKLLFDDTWLAPAAANGMGMQRRAVAGHLRAALPDASIRRW